MYKTTLALVMAVATVAGIGSASAQRVKARLGILSGAAQTSLVVAVKKGFFEKHGFDVEARPLVGGVQGSQALAANQVDWSAGGIEPTIVASANGLPFKPYAMYAKGGDSYGVLVRKDSGIAKLADLKDKRVALSAGTATVYGFNLLLEQAGLNSNSVKKVNASYTSMGQLLIQGAVDAMVGIEPYLTLTEEKMQGQAVMLSRMGKLVQGGGFFFIGDAWAKANPSKLEDAVVALWEAEQFVRQNPKEAAAIFAEFIKTEPAVIQSAYQYLTFDPLVDDFTSKSFENTAKFLFDEKLIPKSVTSKEILSEAQRIGSDLAKKRPELLK